jgi:uncharacterized phiE125 gp8 family phage protein
VSWSIEIVTPPATEPVSLTQARLQCNLGSAGTEDRNLALYIAGARSMLETHLNRGCIITQTVKLTATAEADLALLPVFPISVVDSIEYDGEDATDLFGTLTGPNYHSLPLTGTWPGTIEITVTAGYGAAAAVPPDLTLAMLLAISAMFDNRGALPEDFFDTFDALLEGHRRPAVA